MAIKVECYTLITTVEIGKEYFPKQYTEDWCYNDGVIFTPMGAMNSIDVSSMIEDCEKLGLKRFREKNGEKVIGDYFIASQLTNLNDTINYTQCDWIRVYNDVAWHPSFPMGKGVPTFPCYRGGYYYKSKEVWDTAELSLEVYNKKIDAFYTCGFIEATPFDTFFTDLTKQTWIQQCIEYEEYLRTHPSDPNSNF